MPPARLDFETDRLPGRAPPLDGRRFHFTLEAGAMGTILNIPIRQAGPESTSSDAEQERWVDETLPEGECVFAGTWRFLASDFDRLAALLETVRVSRFSPAAQLALQAAEQALHAPWDGSGPPAFSARALVDDDEREAAREADLRVFDTAVEATEGAPEALLLRARRRSVDHMDPDGARLDLDAALARAPDHVEALSARGVLRRYAGDAEGAESDLWRALELDPTPNRAVMLADLLIALERPSEALLCFDRAIELTAGDTSHVRGQRARARRALGDLPGAIADLDAWLKRRPELCGVRLERARLLREAGLVARAARDLDRLAREAPGYGDARLERGSLLSQRGRAGAALEELEVAARLLPGNLAVRGERGVALHALGRDEEALMELDAYLDACSWSPAYRARAEIRRAQGDLQGAREDVAAGLLLAPDDPALVALRTALEG